MVFTDVSVTNVSAASGKVKKDLTDKGAYNSCEVKVRRDGMSKRGESGYSLRPGSISLTNRGGEKKWPFPWVRNKTPACVSGMCL